MSSSSMNLHVTQERTDEGTRRVLRLTNVHDPKNPTVAAFFDLVGERDVAPPPLLDGFVCGILLYAMRIGQDIRVHGKMSSQAIRNLYELQNAWALWRPAIYHKVRIEPDDVVNHADVISADEAIAAFSGGVDSAFTVLRHAGAGLGLGSYPLKRTVLLVHGFDVALSRPDHLQALKDRTAPLMQELNLELRVLRTNLKELLLQKWEDSFMTQLACCLHNYSHEFRYALVASAKAYDALITPLGSTPGTDYLLSGAALSIVHDGAGFSRTDKVEEIARSPVATGVIKVCWEGQETFTNCGVCEKCVRTQLNFRAVGVTNPACFNGAPDPIPRIPGIILRSYSMCVELKSIIAYANAHGVTDPWVRDLQDRVTRYEIEQAEETRGRLVNALGMAQRGEWNRIAGKLKSKVRLMQ